MNDEMNFSQIFNNFIKCIYCANKYCLRYIILLFQKESYNN